MGHYLRELIQKHKAGIRPVSYTHLYYLKRLRFADEVLMAIEETYLPAKLFPGLTKEVLDTTPLYDEMCIRDSPSSSLKGAFAIPASLALSPKPGGNTP